MSKRNKFISLVILATMILTVTNISNIYAGTVSEFITFYANGFSESDKTSINLTGDAYFPTGESFLKLTDSTSGQAGAAFFNEKIKTTDGFSTFFEFYLSSQSGGGADGLIFIVAKNSNSLGEAGGGMGYTGITESIGVEFDNYQNEGEVSSSHIAINLDGEIPNVTEQTSDLGGTYLHTSTTSPFYAWIDYSDTSNLMRVYISRTSTRPETPTLSYTVDIADYCGDEFYVGFTAATGGSWQNHIISKWYFSNEYISSGLELSGDYDVDKTPPTTPTITNNNETFTFASTDVGSGVDYYEYKINTGAWIKGNDVDLSGETFPFTLYSRAIDKVGNISSIASENIAAPDRTIAFNSNGGSSVSSITDSIGTSISNPTDPTKTNYDFIGWYSDEALTQEVTWPYTISSNKTLYAKWDFILEVIVKEVASSIPNQSLITVTGNETAFPENSVDLIVKESPGILDTIKDTLEEKLGDGINKITIFPLDISFNIKGTDTKIQPAQGTSVTITCPIPENLLPYKESIKVGCIINNKFVLLDTTLVQIEGVYCIQFVAEHFSPYALLIDNDNLLKDTSYNLIAADSPGTGDSIFITILLAGISLGSIIFIVTIKKLKRA